MSFRYLYIGMLAALPGLATAAPPESMAVPTNTVADGQVKVNAQLDRETAQVAEPIRLILTVEAPQGTRVELPQLGEQLGDFSARGIERTEDIPSDANVKLRQWSLSAVLDTVKTGAITIPSLDVHYATDAKSPTFKTLATKPIKVFIQSVLENRADPTKFRDIKEAVDVALPASHSYTWLAWTAAGVGGAIAVALATLAIVKRKRGPSPVEWALAAIADLRKLPIASSADAEAAYNEVVDVIREYFELEFFIPVLAKTTREFLTETTKLVKLEKTSRERLSALASIADEIKFARLGVGEPQVRQALDQAEAFIQECEAYQRAARKEAA